VAWWYAVARCFTSLGLYIPVFLFFHFFSSILKKKKKKKKKTQCVRIESGEVQRISRWSRWSAIFWANVWLFFKYLKREKKQEEKEKKTRESKSSKIYDVKQEYKEKKQQHPSRKEKIQLKERVLIGSNHFYAPTKKKGMKTYKKRKCVSLIK
jgi:hypothetical protein